MRLLNVASQCEENRAENREENPQPAVGVVRSYSLPPKTANTWKPPMDMAAPAVEDTSPVVAESMAKGRSRPPLTPLCLPRPAPSSVGDKPYAGTDSLKHVDGELSVAGSVPEDASTYAPSTMNSVGTGFRTPTCPSPSSQRRAIDERPLRMTPRTSTPRPFASPSASPRGSPRCISPRSCLSPRSTSPVTTPRTRMSDFFHGSNSIIRYPEVQRRKKSPDLSKKPPGERYTKTCEISRKFEGKSRLYRDREGLTQSNECLRWLKRTQGHIKVEDMIDEMLAEQEQQDPGRRGDYRYARERLRERSYRDATMCATSLAKSSKHSSRQGCR